MAYYDALAPYWQNDSAERRNCEPYVYAQFVYGRDHALYGRAENPWLTGSAGWMYTAATKYILGLRPGFDALTVDPCIPGEWPGFSVSRLWRGHRFDIEVRNPSGVCAGVAAVVVNGEPLEPVLDQATGRRVAVIPLPDGAGQSAQVVLTLG